MDVRQTPAYCQSTQFIVLLGSKKVGVQRRRWPEKLTHCRRAASLIEKETLAMQFHISATELSKKLGVSQPSVSFSVKRGEKIAKTGQLELVEDEKVII